MLSRLQVFDCTVQQDACEMSDAHWQQYVVRNAQVFPRIQHQDRVCGDSLLQLLADHWLY